MTVNTQVDSSFIPLVEPELSTTELFMGGGYVGTPLTANSVTGNVHEGYLGVQTVNAGNIPIMDQISNFVKKNPIISALGGVSLLMLFLGRRGR